MTRISILGCGYLGLPLAADLIKRGYTVKGSTTTPAKLSVIREAGAEAYALRLEPQATGERLELFFDTDTLFLNIPPPRREDAAAYHRAQLESILKRLPPSAHLVYASSTSVYPDLNRIVTEEDAQEPEKGSGRVLLEAESFLQRERPSTTILRFAGLYGHERKLGRFLSGKKDVAGGDAPVNLVHRDDCLAVITRIIEEDLQGEVFNVCADGHPTRREVYTVMAEREGLEPPTFLPGTGAYKLVSSERLKTRLGYSFVYPEPLEAP